MIFSTMIKIEGGKMKAHLANLLHDVIASHEGKTLMMTLDEPVKQRNTQQNKYYWKGVLGTIAGHTGHSEDELHSIFKEMFLVSYTKEFQGKEYKICKSTANLNKKEFSEYIDRIIAEASTMGIFVPPSDGSYEENPTQNKNRNSQ